MSAPVLIGFYAFLVGVLIWCAGRPRHRADQAAEDAQLEDWLAQIRALRVDDWPTTQADLDDHATQALAVAADDLDQRRLDRAVHDHPAGGC